MFEQHPVPQQISTYQFRLVGDMTLKQFFQLAGGCALALLVYASPLPGIFKWPLIVLFVVAGAAFAFLPLQERPLEEWLSAFFRSIYGPTLFVWTKSGKVQYFAKNANSIATPGGQVSVEPTVPTDTSVTKLENLERTFLQNIAGVFNGHTKTVPAAVIVELNPVQAPTTPLATQTSERTLFVATPNATPVATARSGFEVKNEQLVTPLQTSQVSPTLSGATMTQNMQARFSPDAAPPSPATIANVVVGQVMSSEGKIVEGAILEITDFQGRPVRALKTNKAGHFMIVTPLPNGTYNMSIEKEGVSFEPVKFETHGAIIEPIAIKAK